MESPGNNYPTRKTYAVLFDMHFFGDDCPYECEKYELYLKEGNDYEEKKRSNRDH